MYSIINMENDPDTGIILVTRNDKGLYLIEFIEHVNANKSVVTLLESQYQRLLFSMNLKHGTRFREVVKP